MYIRSLMLLCCRKFFARTLIFFLSRKHCRKSGRRTQWDVKWLSSWVARDSGKQEYALMSARWLDCRDAWCVVFLDSCHLLCVKVCYDYMLRNQPLEVTTFASTWSVALGNYSSLLSFPYKKLFYRFNFLAEACCSWVTWSRKWCRGVARVASLRLGGLKCSSLDLYQSCLGSSAKHQEFLHPSVGLCYVFSLRYFSV